LNKTPASVTQSGVDKNSRPFPTTNFVRSTPQMDAAAAQLKALGCCQPVGKMHAVARRQLMALQSQFRCAPPLFWR
jgi:hypothetical protein